MLSSKPAVHSLLNSGQSFSISSLKVGQELFFSFLTEVLGLLIALPSVPEAPIQPPPQACVYSAAGGPLRPKRTVAERRALGFPSRTSQGGLILPAFLKSLNDSLSALVPQEQSSYSLRLALNYYLCLCSESLRERLFYSGLFSKHSQTGSAEYSFWGISVGVACLTHPLQAPTHVCAHTRIHTMYLYT